MREEATSRGRRWISSSIHNVVVAHHADSATVLYIRASFHNVSEVLIEWIWWCWAEPFHTTRLGLDILPTLLKVQYAFSLCPFRWPTFTTIHAT